MINIDHISFEFTMDDERFAHSLYADWNGFCRTCFENIVDECLSVYDKDRVLHEIEKLDLDLGSIPQEVFYSEFPSRLREELLKAMPLLQLRQTDMEEMKTAASRFANLLYYLEHGILKTEWANIDFDLSEELDGVTKLDKRYLEKIAGLCIANEHALRRLLLQTDRETPLVRLYSVAMDRMFSVKEGKRYFMEIFLEMQPNVPLRFVHEAEEDGQLHGMAELLSAHSVRRVMDKETAEHAEVDLPSYWHELYEWLIKYYPYNGIAIFGGKSDFIGHLHYRLLTFIRKLNNTFYLSKVELTASFLLEVFGAAYYKQVLNAIYNMQPHNTDHSPVYDGYYNREMYRIFMQLSLLYVPTDMNDHANQVVFKERGDSLLTDFKIEDLSVVLKDADRSDADKRMIVTMLVQQKPEFFISWLKSEANDDTILLTVLARLIDQRRLKRLLASTSLVAMETVDEVMKYLTNLVKEGRLSEEWEEGLQLSENETKDLWVFTGQDDNEIPESIRRLGMLLKAVNISETVKRRLVVSLLERHKDKIANAIWELHKQGLLESAINRISVSAAESVIRLMIVPYIGIGKAEQLMLMVGRLFANENTVSAYLHDKSVTLRAQVFVWLTKEVKTEAGMVIPFMELFSLLLTCLFGKENVSAAIRPMLYGMAGEITTDEMKEDDILKVVELVPYTDSSRVHRVMSVFEQWSQQVKTYLNSVQTLVQGRWNRADNFNEWLEDKEVTTESKRELLQTLAREKPQELTVILRNLPQDERTVSLMANYLPTEVLLDGMGKADAKQELLLSRTIDLLHKERAHFSFLSSMTISFTTALAEALLLFMQDKDTLNGRNLTEQEVIGKFLFCLYYVYTRRTDYNDNKEWKHLQNEVINGIGLNNTDTTSASVSEDATSERLMSEYGSLNNSELYRHIATALDKQPGVFVELSEKSLDTEFIRRICGIADRTMFKRMVTALSSVSGFENHTTFIRLMEWLDIQSVDRIAVSEIMNAILSWISTTDWKRQSSRQMTLFFLSRFYGSDDAAGLPPEMLTNETLPEEVRKRLLRNYMRSRPADLLSHIQLLATQGKLPMDKWAEWAGLSEWLRLIASVSLSLEELLRQITEFLLSKGGLINETALIQGLLTFIAANDVTRFTYYINKGEVVNSFLLLLPVIHERTKNEDQEIKNQMMENLGITPEEERVLESSQENSQEIAFTGSAGLCLPSPWFPKLFAMLSYLNEDKRDFKDTASRIRAVFLLQYMASSEEKEYREPELAFNRLLVALPAHVPLPRQIELTDEEKRTADSMLKGVKDNWSKMSNTSLSGFRESFIMRNGQLEQRDEKWLLMVESRAYDILLDSVPWMFRQIYFPWLKKYVRVLWHEKQEF